MAPRPKEEVASSHPGLWKYPSYRDSPLKSGALWLKGKQKDDGAEGLWRIHDELYDLTRWINNHPGGSDWLTMTKGTDITEAFESHHLFDTAEKLLPVFHVRRASTRRNSPYTFHAKGFYRTLKSRVRDALRRTPSGPTPQSKMFADVFVAVTVATAILATTLGSYMMAVVSGLFLTFTTICAHNFFHQKDNFRMYYFHLSLMSSRDWRISHALSHHLYPNTLLDLEVSLFEPILQWLPKEKSKWEKYGGWLYSPILYTLACYVQVIMRFVLTFNGFTDVMQWSDLIALTLPAAMYAFGGVGVGVVDVLLKWIVVVASSSFFFGVIGINGGHHHPEIFHDGDVPREDTDWGLQQLDAVRDRKEISANLFLVLVNFGHHSLHHLFPTIDHAHLDALYPILEDTCREFGVDYQRTFTSTVVECVKGQFQQLAKTQPNRVAPTTK